MAQQGARAQRLCLLRPHQGHLRSGGLLGPSFPLLTWIPGLFLSLQSLAPRSRSHRGKELAGGGLDWRLSHCCSLGVPSNNLSSAHQCRGGSCPCHPAGLSLPTLGLNPVLGRPSCCSWPRRELSPPRSLLRLRALGPWHSFLQGSQERPHYFLCSEGSLCSLGSGETTQCHLGP